MSVYTEQGTYKGTWDAKNNVPLIPAASTSNKNWYYQVLDGNTKPPGSNIANWKVGDWLVSDGTSWNRPPYPPTPTPFYVRGCPYNYGVDPAMITGHSPRYDGNIDEVNGRLDLIQAELDRTEASDGIDTDGTFITPSGSYINDSSSLRDAAEQLDSAIEDVVAGGITGIDGGEFV